VLNGRAQFIDAAHEARTLATANHTGLGPLLSALTGCLERMGTRSADKAGWAVLWPSRC